MTLGSIVFFVVLLSVTEGLIFGDQRTSTRTLTVDNGGNWGSWRPIKYCPEHTFAVGYKLKIESDQLFGDDTALNSVMLQCADLHGNHKVAEVESDEGNWGTWTDLISCNTTHDQSVSDNDTVPFDFIVGFRLEVESQQGNGDDTAANYMEALCRDPDGQEYIISGKHLSGNFGSFGAWSRNCAEDNAVCGIQSRLEAPVGKWDDTSLNDVKLFCCKIF